MTMKRYVGTKIIHAEPADRAGTPGYFVQYEDGYTSWSLKAVFESAYQEAEELTFGMAVAAMRIGKRVARKGWNGEGMFLYLVKAFERQACNDVERAFFVGYFGPQLVQINMKTVDGYVVAWLANQTDILSDDWIILE